ncbi:MAG: superoxide dismutase [Lentisphaeria bacterium]|jgi:Fe-Mn family superoxide dismutase
MKKQLAGALLALCALGLLAQDNFDLKRFAPLPYAYDALEPHIDAQTMEIHYSRHHRNYFNSLQKALEATPDAPQDANALFARISTLPAALRNNAGGHYNHTLFWSVMAPKAGGVPQGALAEQINATFGSFDRFKELFKQAALTRFGSGWAWLCVAKDGSLFISSTANQDNPLMDVADKQGTPILGLDVWEHAYYLKYQNQRGAYIDAFWNVVNWPEVAARRQAARN